MARGGQRLEQSWKVFEQSGTRDTNEAAPDRIGLVRTISLSCTVLRTGKILQGASDRQGLPDVVMATRMHAQGAKVHHLTRS
jgi:hypothetical protein